MRLLVAGGSAGDGALDDLTPRERQVLGEMAQGKSNAAVAEHLVLTKKAVEKHVGSIFLKLGLPEEQVVSRGWRPCCCISPPNDRSSETDVGCAPHVTGVRTSL